MENPAYWRMVHGWVVYIVGYGPAQERRDARVGVEEVEARAGRRRCRAGLIAMPSGDSHGSAASGGRRRRAPALVRVDGRRSRAGPAKLGDRHAEPLSRVRRRRATASASPPAYSCPSTPGTSTPARRAGSCRAPAARSAATAAAPALGVERVGASRAPRPARAVADGRRDRPRPSRWGPPRPRRSRRRRAGCAANAGAGAVARRAGRAWRGSRGRAPVAAGTASERSRRPRRRPPAGRPAGRRSVGRAGRRARRRRLGEVRELADPGDRRAPGGDRLLPAPRARPRRARRPARRRARRRRRPPPRSPGRTPSAARARPSVSDSTDHAPPAGSATRARCASLISSDWVLRAIRRANGVGQRRARRRTAAR